MINKNTSISIFPIKKTKSTKKETPITYSSE